MTDNAKVNGPLLELGITATKERKMAWRGEIEDGTGWGGLVASKSEQRAEARQAALEKDAQRYRWLAKRLLAADFDYNGEGVQVLVFSMPAASVVSANCDATIDYAMAVEAKAKR